MSLAHRASPVSVICPHCGNEAPEGGREFPFCCAGCREVHALLQDRGLTRYYDLARRDGVPAVSIPPDRSQAWLEPLLTAAEAQPGSVVTVTLDIQGLHCAACVWLINELFRRRPGAAGVTVNPALGKLELSWQRGQFDVPAFLREVESFGYRVGPSRKRTEAVSRDLPMRIGVCAAIAMNVMMFSVSFYAGLAPADGQLFQVFSELSLWLSALAVAVGGWPFFKAAGRGLRRGVLHLDLPIATGMLLAFGTSLLKARAGRGDLAYFDTLDVFVTLMLVGRWLQQRLLERNRRFLLDDSGTDGIHVRRREGSRLVVRRAPEIRVDDLLCIAPGDLVPVEAELHSLEGSLSLDWINGESAPLPVTMGAKIPAGAFNAGRTAIFVRVLTSFADSPLPALLRAGVKHSRPAVHARLTEIVSRIWVPVVLSLAAIGLWWWWPRGPAAALDVTTGLLIVTCPCSIGIALPLAYELALARLRRAGVFVRSGDLLDRILRMRRVLFDKTGTLTLGRLELINPKELHRLELPARDALYDMTARSNHPVSKCLSSLLASQGAQFSTDGVAVEHPGLGMELTRRDHVYRLGKPGWAAPAEPGIDSETAVFAIDNQPIAHLELRESIRPDARHEIAELSRRGLDVWIISGDSRDRVARAASALGLPPDHALSGQSPADKAAAVQKLGAKDALFIGDGVNDSLAFEQAGITGTPAIDRPVMPGKADFFLMGDGISGVRALLETAQTLRATMYRLLILAQAYNALAIAGALTGHMTPLRAAVAMPLSSLSVVLLTVASFSHRRNAGPSPQRSRPNPTPERAFA